MHTKNCIFKEWIKVFHKKKFWFVGISTFQGVL